MWREFKAFLIKENALSLAIAVVIGVALNSVVQALVEGIVMPIVGFATPDNQTWQTLTIPPGNEKGLRVGLVLNALLNFIIVGFVAWRLSKLLIRPAAAAPAKATKTCPMCFSDNLDARATRCPNCTGAVG
jgi:large conductance mechanosensitive channel